MNPFYCLCVDAAGPQHRCQTDTQQQFTSRCRKLVPCTVFYHKVRLVDSYDEQRQGLATHRVVSAVTPSTNPPVLSSRSISCSLSNAKPSAIFRLRGTFIPSANATSFKHPSLAAAAAPATTAHLGFSCEPVAAVEAQVAALGSTAAVANPASSSALVVSGSQASVDPLTLAQRVGKNLVSYVGGFAQAVTLPDGTTKYALDLSVVEKWYRYALSKHEVKVATDVVPSVSC